MVMITNNIVHILTIQNWFNDYIYIPYTGQYITISILNNIYKPTNIHLGGQVKISGSPPRPRRAALRLLGDGFRLVLVPLADQEFQVRVLGVCQLNADLMNLGFR